jgi:hypothetical protein
MPNATSSADDTTRFDLKSLPEGYVVLKRMTYGQMVQRRALTKMSVMQGRTQKSVVGEMAMASKEITLFEFGHTIVEHNLEDVDGRKLNLSLEPDFDKLDPRVGQEIEDKISEMNNFEDEEDEQGK